MGIYRRLLSQPDIGVLIAATTLTRIPFAINGLAVLLFVRDVTGSFATAGLVTGGLALGAAIGAPVAARLVDRRGARALLPLACGHAAALTALIVLGELDAPAVALAAVALVAGSCFPPSGSVLRARFGEILGGDAELIRGAYALDSVTIEVSFVSGPLITAVAVALAAPEVAIGISAVLVILGTAVFNARLPAELRLPRDPALREGGFLGALSDPGVRIIALGTVPIGFCIGAVEVALPAFSEAEGSPELAGSCWRRGPWRAASAASSSARGAVAARRSSTPTCGSRCSSRSPAFPWPSAARPSRCSGWRCWPACRSRR